MCRWPGTLAAACRRPSATRNTVVAQPTPAAVTLRLTAHTPALSRRGLAEGASRSLCSAISFTMNVMRGRSAPNKMCKSAFRDQCASMRALLPQDVVPRERTVCLDAGSVWPVRPVLDAGLLQSELWTLHLNLHRQSSSRQRLLMPSAGPQAVTDLQAAPHALQSTLHGITSSHMMSAQSIQECISVSMPCPLTGHCQIGDLSISSRDSACV